MESVRSYSTFGGSISPARQSNGGMYNGDSTGLERRRLCTDVLPWVDWLGKYLWAVQNEGDAMTGSGRSIRSGRRGIAVDRSCGISCRGKIQYAYSVGTQYRVRCWVRRIRLVWELY